MRSRFDPSDPEVNAALTRWGDVLLRKEDDGTYRPVNPQSRHNLTRAAWRRQMSAFTEWTNLNPQGRRTVSGNERTPVRDV